MKFPQTIQFRAKTAKIYGKTAAYEFYRAAYQVAGKRVVRSFQTFKEAKEHAENKLRELATGNQAMALTDGQARDALIALERLQSFYQNTGRMLSLSTAVSSFVEAAEKLQGCSLGEAVTGYLQTVVTVKTKSVAESVEEFIATRQHKTEAKDGKRAQLSQTYAVHVNSWLREFASTFIATAVRDLSKVHLNAYAQTLTAFAPKTRNHRRNTIKMFLKWCVRQDYLPVNHRLFEADGMARELSETGETDFFSPSELKKLLDNTNPNLRPVIAIAGLAGLRGEEIMRLDWADVWRATGYIEVSARNAKTRQRRLVEVCPALAIWMEPFRANTVGKVYPRGVHAYQHEFLKLRKDLKINDRNNGLRHAFCTYHFALHANENLTAQQAGNSPAMIHKHYKGLATKAEAEKWFAVMPKENSGDKGTQPAPKNNEAAKDQPKNDHLLIPSTETP